MGNKFEVFQEKLSSFYNLFFARKSPGNLQNSSFVLVPSMETLGSPFLTFFLVFTTAMKARAAPSTLTMLQGNFSLVTPRKVLCMELVLPDSEKMTFHTEKFCSSMQDLLYFCAEPVPYLKLFWVKGYFSLLGRTSSILRTFLGETSEKVTLYNKVLFTKYLKFTR